MQSDKQTSQAPQTVILQQAPKDSNPGLGLGIAGFVCSFFSIFGLIAVIALVLSIVGLIQSKKAKKPNGLAVAGIVLSSIGLTVNLLWLLMLMISFMTSSVSSV